MGKLSIIAAIGKNREIGVHGQLPWHLPRDLEYFRQVTMGHAVIMGRHTMYSIPKLPLKGRINIVVSTTLTMAPEGVYLVHSIEEAINLAQSLGVAESFILGGETLFAEGLLSADSLYLTEVDAFFPEADRFFPEVDKAEWMLIESRVYPKDEKNKYDTRYSIYKRK